MKNISTKNIVTRFKKAMDDLTEADQDLADLREQLGPTEWNRFTSHTAGWMTSHLLNSNPEQDDV